MRLCFIADGGSIHTQRWVNYFAAREHEVHLISSRFTEGYEGFDSRIRMHQLASFLPKLWKVSRYLNGIVWSFQVRALIIRIKPDIVNAHYVGVPAYLAAASGFHPLVLTAWGSDILIDPKRNPIYRFFTRIALRKADYIICVSSVLKEEVARLASIEDKIRVIPMGVDAQKFGPKAKNKVLLESLHVADSPVVISIRNLKPVYNVETLIRAIPMILQEIPKAKFIIGGEGQQRSFLESTARALGVSDSVRFVGWIPHGELPKYLISSDVYVSTSLSDSLGVSNLEAMACGLPVVVGDLPAIREWTVDGDDGFIFPVKDHQALAKAVVRLLKDENLRRKVGEAARKVVTERAEYREQMAKVEAVYRESISSDI